jgi:putative ABC transport system permease protein
MTLFRQIGAVVAMNIRSLPQRVATSLVVVIGIAGVVAVLISVLSLSTGLTRTLASTGKPDRALVLHSGSTAEVGSNMPRDEALAAIDAPGVRRGADGKPIASAEMLASVRIARKDGTLGTATLRGVSPSAFALRPEVQLVEGRMFQSGLREAIVGRAAQERYAGLDVGRTVKFGDDEWRIVGAFQSSGDARESEVLADSNTVLSAYNRTTLNSVTVQLESVAAYDQFKNSLTSNPTVSVEVKREPEYYEQQSKLFASFLAVVANLVAAIMGIGAVFAALNTMYSSVSGRLVEIATLRALGFGSTAVISSVLVEALLLALVGAIVGAGLAWLLFNGNTVSTLSGGQSLTQVVFQLRIGWGLVIAGIVWACVIGIIGGLLPAIRAARIPVATALRAT